MRKKSILLATLTAVAIVAVLFASSTTLADPGLETTNPDDFFTNLLENYASIGQGYAIFEFKNPLSTAFNISPNMFYAELDTFTGNPATVSLSVEKTYNSEYTTLENVCNQTIVAVDLNGSNIINRTCSQVSVYHNNTKSSYEPLNSLALQSGQAVKIKITGTWQVSNSNSREWYPVVNLSGTKIKQLDWALWAFDLIYCTNITVTTGNVFSYQENQTVLAAFINFSAGGTSPLPYNDSIRIASAPCNVGGQELPSSWYPITQNGTGHMSYAYGVIKQNGTVTANITYAAYYNYSSVGIGIYTTDLVVLSNGTKNTYYDDVFTAGALSQTKITGDANWVGSNAGADAACISSETSCAAQTTGTTTLAFNSSMLAVFDSKGQNGLIDNTHFYPAYSFTKQIRLNQSNTATTSAMYNYFITPNGETTSITEYLGPAVNATATSDGDTSTDLSRGMACTWKTGDTSGLCWVWNSTRNMTRSTIQGGFGQRFQFGHNANQESYENVVFTRVYIRGSSDVAKIINITNYWEGFVNNPVKFASGISTYRFLVQPNLTSPFNGSILGVLPEFNWTNIAEAENYTIQISTDAGFSFFNYTRTLSSNKDTNVTLQTGQINRYYWRVIAATNGYISSTSQVYNFNYSQWNITFNITGSDVNQPERDNTTIKDCSYSGFNQNNDFSNLYGPFAFPNGTWSCTFNRSSYYPTTQNFSADSDKIINIVLPQTGGATFQEHTWLEAIYNCVIQKQCDLYNLLLEINQSAGYTWQHFKPTDSSVVLNETFGSRTLNSTSNITVNYTINIPVKAGYALGTYLPVRIGFWFLNQTNGSCYSQGTLPTGVTVIEPYCNPLIVQTMGQMGSNVTFRVDLRPSLSSGFYEVKRIVEIDPNEQWIGYGQDTIGTITVGEPNSNYGSNVYSLEGQSANTQPQQAQNATGITNVYNTYNYVGMTGDVVALPTEFVFGIVIIIIILLVAVFYLYKKKRK